MRGRATAEVVASNGRSKSKRRRKRATAKARASNGKIRSDLDYTIEAIFAQNRL